MIWQILWWLVLMVGRLLVPAPAKRVISRSTLCPACGNHECTIKFRRVLTTGSQVTRCIKCQSSAIGRIGGVVKCNQCGEQVQSNSTSEMAFVELTCDTCQFAWFEEPVSAPERPAV